ncbi:MAG TPA: tetratricopeptide repeat protein [Methylomirabilota bacterium]|nr:tetratricopeptide repeat protein [Methylomirabilota bacterium]
MLQLAATSLRGRRSPRQYAETIRVLNEAVARDPNDADTHSMLGFAFRKRHDLDRAFAHYREALRLAPRALIAPY